MFRHGQALDLKQEYLGSPAKAGKENAAPEAKSGRAAGNWPEVEIRVASSRAGDLTLPGLSCGSLPVQCHIYIHPQMSGTRPRGHS